MTKYFAKQETEDAFKAWLGVPTFNTTHPADARRWNEFVLCALKNDELLEREFIYNELKDEYGEKEADRFASEYKVRFERLDSFYKLAHQDIKRLLIENKNLHSSNLALEQDQALLKR